MQHNVNPVMWILGNAEDKIMEFDSSGGSVVFSDDIIKKSYSHDVFSLYDIQNDIMYSIDLNNGEFIINGVPVCPSKESFGRLTEFSGLNVDYRSGLIQYKECFPIAMFSSGDVKPMTFNIGYKIDTTDLNLVFEKESYSSQVVKAMIIFVR